MTKIILGGGLSGLSAAYYLGKRSPKEKVILLEGTNRLGGWIKSERVDKEVIFEQAARTIRPRGAAGINTLNLLGGLGLNSEVKPIITSNAAAKNRLIYANGQLHLLPTSLFSIFTTQKPFSKPLLYCLLQDFASKPKFMLDDSIYEFTNRRFGPEVADYLIDTIVCGICAGNSREVSVNFLMKNMFLDEQKYGSVLKGAIQRLIFGKKEKLPQRGLLATRSKTEKWSIYRLKNGLETLPIALHCALQGMKNVDIHLNTRCTEISFKSSDSVSVKLNGSKHFVGDHIFSSIPATSLAPLVQLQHPQLAGHLFSIKSVTVAVVNLFYKGNFIPQPAFGFLVPPKEKLPILGVIYDSCSQEYSDKTVLTVMMGGYWFKDLFGENPSEETLLKVACDNVKSILHIKDSPLHYKVNVLRDCLPQYVVGHEKNLSDIISFITQNKLPLSLCGASYHGVSVNEVILSAKDAVDGLQDTK
ncbi:protoporphyrinogen oxidase [Euwallacea similis]|uniref:protoporphyrinogen oxidase n=1 Tax=Euwallacea similis TaxID=1736056 RepID=UPI00344C7702